jgi:excisionase family DNA binding protein
MYPETQNPTKPLLKVPEVARLLDVKEHRVRELARQNLIPHVRIGRQLRFESGQLRVWIEAGGQALPGGWRRAADVSSCDAGGTK